PATPKYSPLSLHDALPISRVADMGVVIDGRAADIHPDIVRIDRLERLLGPGQRVVKMDRHRPSRTLLRRRAAARLPSSGARGYRSEEHTSELQSRENLVCR